MGSLARILSCKNSLVHEEGGSREEGVSHVVARRLSRGGSDGHRERGRHHSLTDEEGRAHRDRSSTDVDREQRLEEECGEEGEDDVVVYDL